MEGPSVGSALKGLVSKIKKEMTAGGATRVYHDPVGWGLLKQEIPADFIQLTPGGCETTESALSAVPTLIVCRTKPITGAIFEAKRTNITVAKFRKLKWIHEEGQKDGTTFDLHSGVGRVRLGVPPGA